MDKHKNTTTLFGATEQETPEQLALAMAPAVTAGHYDELRGAAPALASSAASAPPSAGTAAPRLTPHWRQFFDHLGTEGFSDLPRRVEQVARQVRDNGVTYNVYADAGGAQRPWALDLFPAIVTPQDWQRIEAGVLQRTRVLNTVLCDAYGEQRLLERAWLPAALVQGHPGYLRPMHGIRPPGDTWLNIAAFDLARGPDGHWWVVSQRTQAPSGLGYLLENRITISRQFPQAFSAMKVQRLAATYRALMDGLKAMSPAGGDARIVLLTPGPYNETYFEHAYLARYLGLSLVEGSDLTVRDERLYLKTMQGLEPVHGVLKRLDDEYLDPLELRADSTLGVPGLVQAIRAGHVLVANTPGSGFLESPALLGFMPALARELLGEELSLPALPTWWCGEQSVLSEVLPRLASCVIKPSWPGTADSVIGRSLSRRELDEWAGRILRRPEEHTIQQWLPLSHTPTWHETQYGSHITPRASMLRVFAIADGPRSWRVLPGGMARIAGANEQITSMQRGGSSADTWVMTEGQVDSTTLLSMPVGDAFTHRSRSVSSRAAENLFWFGRYTERCEHTVRLARITLECLNGEDQNLVPLMQWISQQCEANALVLPDVPAAGQSRRVFERSLIAGLGDTQTVTSVGYNLRAIRNAAMAVRERLSLEQWNLIRDADREYFGLCEQAQRDGELSAPEAIRALDILSARLAAMTGAQTDRMTRDDGWRCLSIGRHVERLAVLTSALAQGFETRCVLEPAGFEAMLALFDSTITFRAQYQQRRDVPALLDLLVLDRDNPRSLGWVARTLRGRIAKVGGSPADELSPLAHEVPDPGRWPIAELMERDDQGQYQRLIDRLWACHEKAFGLSDGFGALYFSHSAARDQSVGA